MPEATAIFDFYGSELSKFRRGGSAVLQLCTNLGSVLKSQTDTLLIPTFDDFIHLYLIWMH